MPQNLQDIFDTAPPSAFKNHSVETRNKISALQQGHKRQQKHQQIHQQEHKHQQIHKHKQEHKHQQIHKQEHKHQQILQQIHKHQQKRQHKQNHEVRLFMVTIALVIFWL